MGRDKRGNVLIVGLTGVILVSSLMLFFMQMGLSHFNHLRCMDLSEKLAYFQYYRVLKDGLKNQLRKKYSAMTSDGKVKISVKDSFSGVNVTVSMESPGGYMVKDKFRISAPGRINW